MTPSPFNKSPILDIHRYIVFPSDFNPTQDSGIDVNELMRILPEEELYEIVQDITLAPHIKGSRYSPTVKHAGWSPMKITHNMRSLLTILTDSGGLDIYSLSNNNWKHILSISNQWHCICKSEWDRNFEHNVTRAEILKLLKQRTYKIKITAFAWGEVHTGSVIWCPLFAGTKDGMILIWKVSQVSTTVNAELVSVVESNLGQITALNGELVNQEHYLLFCAALNGRIQTHFVCLLDKADSAAIVGQTYEAWIDEDRIEIPGGGLVSACWSGRVILAAAKGPHLLLILNSYQGPVITNCIVNSNNLAITGVSFITPENLIMTTTEGTVYVVTVGQDPNGFLQTRFSTIQSSIQFENYRCNGFAMSNSHAIMCLAFSVQGNYDHLQLREYSQAVWCTMKELDDAIAEINNHIGPLYDVWDIFELVRIQWLKKNMTEKVFSIHNTEELDVMDVNKLKKNLWFVEISLKLDSLPNDTKKSLESLKDEMTILIMSSHVFKRVTQLISNSGDEITQLDEQSLRIMRHWLFYLVNIGLKTSYAATHATASTLLQQIDDSVSDADKVSETCNICRARVESVEDISTAICAQGHSIPRCVLSMVQCAVIGYYICPVCKIVAHPSAVTPTRCTCVFCDYYLRADEKVKAEDCADADDAFYL
ncbi:uncharacterized protein isoform X3 [Rhodnius prolixus]